MKQTYLTQMPKAVPAGWFLVHNHVRPTVRLGSRGFRAWLQDSRRNLALCDCAWTRLQHYRIKHREERQTS